VHEGARRGEVVVAVYAEDDLSGNHVERLIPGMAVRRRAAAFGAGLAEDLIASGGRALIAMKDSAGLDDDDEIVATLDWAASTLLRTALHDIEEPW
jgi:hypothetical protein